MPEGVTVRLGRDLLNEEEVTAQLYCVRSLSLRSVTLGPVDEATQRGDPATKLRGLDRLGQVDRKAR